MNNLKLRAWADGHMHYAKDDMYWYITNSGYWSLNSSGENETDGIICDNLESADPILMLYTTIPDTTGRKICEGDIIPDDEESNGSIFIVIYDEEKAAFMLELYGIETYTGENGQMCEGNFCYIDTMSLDDFDSLSIWATVIGNRYENANYLKGDTEWMDQN